MDKGTSIFPLNMKTVILHFFSPPPPCRALCMSSNALDFKIKFCMSQLI